MPEVQKTDEQWQRALSPERYKILHQKGTEPPFSGEFVEKTDAGMYVCGACDNELFKSETKFESTLPGLVGWPAFNEVAKSEAVELVSDTRHGMSRTEAVCKRCGSHLGHYFDDPTSVTGKHYCVNSLSLNFKANRT